ncbi:MAG TPA: hypothetical protein DHV36_17415 [Desulfobacteraceae bacterium]|nr:hypothetical protein [Desulfobacteraceae bacterium]
MTDDWMQYMGTPVVLDTTSSWIYIGTLEAITDESITLSEADAHDISDTDITKELYIHKSRTEGIRVNRDRVIVSRAFIVGLSALDAVKAF